MRAESIPSIYMPRIFPLGPALPNRRRFQFFCDVLRSFTPPLAIGNPDAICEAGAAFDGYTRIPTNTNIFLGGSSNTTGTARDLAT